MQQNLGAIIFDISGYELSHEDIEILQHPNIGGVILFARNYESPEQLKSLTKEIRANRANCLICVDQEGGRVQRFVDGFSRLPAMTDLGKLTAVQDSLVDSLACDIGQLMALELRSLGVDLSFAPVLDLATDLNPVVRERAIHSDPKIVTRIATQYMLGMQKAGMSACGKHFPGHGKVKVDSHLALPIDHRKFDELTDDLQPFQALINSSIQAIMPGHLLFPEIDDVPAVFSKKWLQDILTTQLGFKGCIISDDLNMDATSGFGDMASCVEKALTAGCHFVLTCNNRSGVISAIQQTQVDFSPFALAKRQLLFPKQPAVAWDELAAHEQWQKAKSSLQRFQALQ